MPRPSLWCVTSTATLFATLLPIAAQEKIDSKKAEGPLPAVPAAKGEVQRRLAFPNPYPRLRALEGELKKAGVDIKWEIQYDTLARRDIDTSALRSDPEKAQVLMGVRIADAIPALLAKNSSRLKACAQDVKALAQVLQIKSGDISTDPIIRAMEKDDWDGVFMELGDLQQQVIDRLDTLENRSKGALIAAGAWLQGLRYASKVIIENHAKVDLSNFLRSAPIAEILGVEIKTATPESLSKPAVKAALSTLTDVFPILNIGRTDNIPKEKVEKLFELATQALSDAKA